VWYAVCVVLQKKKEIQFFEEGKEGEKRERKMKQQYTRGDNQTM